MTLPAFDPDLVQLDDSELEAVKKFYNTVRKGQETLSDGFQLEDLFVLPEILGDGKDVYEWVISGRPGDPSDDDAVARRIASLGFGLVRASGLLEKLGSGEPETEQPEALPENAQPAAGQPDLEGGGS